MTKRATQMQEEVMAALGHNEAVRTGERQQEQKAAAAQTKGKKEEGKNPPPTPTIFA
jgi:hypothetical protein